MTALPIQWLNAAGLRLGYRQAGEGPAVVLLHGWPTSSYLWRSVTGPIADHHRVVALDLPGFGASAKPVDARYEFAFFDQVLDDALDALGIERVSLVVHDLGGPVGLHWATRRADRISALVLLNTLVYPELCEETIEFARTLLDPDRRGTLTSDESLATMMRLGVADANRITPEVLAAVTAPFQSPDDRIALARAGCGLRRRGLAEIARWLPTVSVPVRIIYGEQDRLLPDVAQTMARVAGDVPHAQVTVLPNCGHFLQEDDPDRVGRLLADFLAGV